MGNYLISQATEGRKLLSYPSISIIVQVLKDDGQGLESKKPKSCTPVLIRN
jgi:hypothetical protein